MNENKIDLVIDFAEKCLEVMNIDRTPNIKIRNEKNDIAAFNKTNQTIYFHSDILFVSEKFMKTVVAHEIAHFIVGYEHQHDKVWVDCCNKLKNYFDDEIFNIYKNLNQYDEKIVIGELKKGKFFQYVEKEYPFIKNNFVIGLNTLGGSLSDIQDEKLLIRPTLYSTDKEFITDDVINDLEADLYYLEDF